MIRKIMKGVLWVLCFAVMQWGGITGAAEFPTRPIDLIIPFAPGGPSDTMGRSITPKMSEVLGQPVVPINKPGATGAVASALLAKAKPDGYTILICSTSHMCVIPHFEKVGYDTLTDFTFIAKLFNQPNTMIVVQPDAPWKSIEELFDYAQKNPKKIKYGTPGQFSGAHIAMEAIAREKAMEWVHIPFKGDGPCVTALLGGHINCGIVFAGHIPHLKAGKLKGLVTARSIRSPNFPEVPCLRDVGIKFEGIGSTEAISGIIAPKGLPKDIVRKYELALEQAFKSQEFLRASQALYLDPKFLTGEGFRKEIEGSYRYIADLALKLGFK